MTRDDGAPFGYRAAGWVTDKAGGKLADKALQWVEDRYPITEDFSEDEPEQ